MPDVSVKMQVGRSDADKRALADKITDAIRDTPGDGPGLVSVAIENVPPSQWMSSVYGSDLQNNEDEVFGQFGRPSYSPLA